MSLTRRQRRAHVGINTLPNANQRALPDWQQLSISSRYSYRTQRLPLASGLCSAFSCGTVATSWVIEHIAELPCRRAGPLL